MAKTFLPTLARILNEVCNYVTRYRVQIEKNLAPNDISGLLDSLVEVCQAIRELCISKDPIQP